MTMRWTQSVVGATVAAAVAVGTVGGCAAPGGSAYRPPTAAMRNTTEAERLSRRAADLIESDPEAAEALLRRAIEADLYYGPAHNNLGVVFFNRGDLYEAANEFEWARKLLPGDPDPRLNLALTLERAGRVDDAIEGYRTALDVRGEHLPTIQALARCQVRYGRENQQTAALLDVIALRGDPDWREWARGQLAQMPR